MSACNCIGGNPCPCQRRDNPLFKGAELGSWRGMKFIESPHLAKLGIDMAVQNGDRTYLAVSHAGGPLRWAEVRTGPRGEIDLLWFENHHGQMGSAHYVSGEQPERDRAEQLRRVAEEITGESFGSPTKRRMGFL